MAKTNSRRTEKTGSALKSHLKIGVFGSGGRMGQEILSVIKEVTGENAFLALDFKKQNVAAHSIVSDFKNPLCLQVQVWIDFSSAEGFSEIYQFCKKNKVALVSGTTGLSKVQLKEMDSPAFPLLWSPNMSLGINVLLKALNSLESIEGFDFQIEEFHHRYKKDKPSGTAILLQNQLEKVVGKKLEKPLSIRGGGIFGIHKVWAMSDDETITFEHQVLNRRVFAKGAVKAAQWLTKQKNGLYSLQDLLGSR